MLVSQIFSSEPSQEPAADQPAASQKLRLKAPYRAVKEKEVFKPASDDKPKESIQDYEQEYENQLKDILETIIGVEDVSIVVNVDATSLKIFEKNRKPRKLQRMRQINREASGRCLKCLQTKKSSSSKTEIKRRLSSFRRKSPISGVFSLSLRESTTFK